MNVTAHRPLLAAGLALLVINLQLLAADAPAGTFSPELKPAAVLDVMQHVADWQLAQPQDTNRPTVWIQAVGDVGMVALAGISADPKYRDAMMALGTNINWDMPGYRGRQYHADDQCIGQVWTELYFQYHKNVMLAPTRARLDYILAHPPTTPGMAYNGPRGQEQWSWCDALFMAPPTWLRLAAATEDERYLDFAVTNWWRTVDYLYDPEAHLISRDNTYLNQKEANGQKIFWSRGNGWVFAAIPRMLQYLPANHPDRPRFEQLFKDMAAKIADCQQPDGLWHASLLDPDSYPLGETSGSGLFTYGLAWGVNQGLLDRAKYELVVRKAWPALVDCVAADGKLTHVQPAGSAPKTFAADATAPYGVGAFLLAGSEVYRLAVLTGTKAVSVKVTNPAPFRRTQETVELSVKEVVAGGVDVARFAPGKLSVLDARSSRILDSQIYASQAGQSPDTLIFQVDLAPGETQTYVIVDSTALAAVPAPLVKTMARYVPERYDDFCWESDCIAHRTYGLALIKAEGTISSGPDVWIKKQRGLICDILYSTKKYHVDNGEFMDDFRVGNSRGCGGTAIWDGKKMHVSSNYRNWKLIVSGPLRSVFELTYDAWDAGGGRMVSETKRYSIDAGSWFTLAQSTFASPDPAPLIIAVGLAERACGPDGTEMIAQDQAAGWLSYWQPEDKPKDIIGDAIILPRGSVQEFTSDAPDMTDAAIHAVVKQPSVEGAPPLRNLLAISHAEVGKPFTYYFGATWSRSRDFTSDQEWHQYVKHFAERRDAPLQVTVGN